MISTKYLITNKQRKIRLKINQEIVKYVIKCIIHNILSIKFKMSIIIIKLTICK